MSPLATASYGDERRQLREMPPGRPDTEHIKQRHIAWDTKEHEGLIPATGSLELLDNVKIHLAIANRIYYLEQIAGVIEHLHKAPALPYGDLCLDNLFVNSRKRIRLRPWPSDYLRQEAACAANDFTLQIQGSPVRRSLAPEIHLEMRLPTTESDVYSFGMLALQMYIGRPVFKDMSDPEFALWLALKERPHIPHHLPSGIRSLIEECTQPDPPVRPTMAEVHKRLLALLTVVSG